MDASEIEAYLREVDAVLTDNDPVGRKHKVVVAGGALLAWTGRRDATRDVDTVEPIAPELAEAVALVAARHDLPVTWLNDSARGFLPQGFDESDCRRLLALPRLTVLGVSDRTLFLMKINAARARGIDFQDAARLWSTAGFVSAGDATAAYWAAYPHEDPASDPYLDSYIESVIAHPSG